MKPQNSLLNNPPYVQLAIDIPYLSEVEKLLSKISVNLFRELLVEIGTPLMKNEGLKSIVPILRKYCPENYIIADFKTLDVGKLEVRLGYEGGVNACVVSGLAPLATILSFINECRTLGIDSWLDTLGLGVAETIKKIKQMKEFPKVIIIHRGIDEELLGKKASWKLIQELKTFVPSLIACAGGISLNTVQDPLTAGGDILIIGRAIYQADDPSKALSYFYKAIS
ncbi:MAG: orotidine 5'-phosphate decarboxylase / HUMPS family protein [Candidatus Hodarchaeales archaeon]|jgi:bifunctional enzyme Fae/Hps